MAKVELGNYVHLNMSNYLKHGTYTTRPGGPTNFNSNIFKSHYSMILAQASMKLSGASAQIKTLEERYNDANQKQYQLFHKIINQDNKTKDEIALLKALLSLVSKSIADNADEIIKGLKSDANGRMYYAGGGINIQNGMSYNFDYLNRHDTRTPDGDYYAKRIIDAAKKLDSQLREMQQNGAQIAESEFAKVKQVIAYLQGLIPNANTVDNIQAEIVNNIDMKSKRSLGRIKKEIAGPAIEILKGIYSRMATVDNINRVLSYRIPEIIGNLVAQKSSALAIDELNDTILKNLKIAGDAKTTRQMLTFTPYQRFEPESKNRTLIAEYRDNKNKDGKTLGQIFFDGIGKGVDQKADVVFEGVGISLKTTNMTQYPDITKGSFGQIPHISLQSSSILLYLMGIEQDYENIGNHYLNALAAHGNKGDVANIMRADALKSLRLYMLYSAATGQGQLRSGQMAQVFAIWDKGSDKTRTPKIKLYSIKSAIQKAIEKNMYGMLFEPDLNTIFLKNDKVELGGDDKEKAGIRVRISNMLVDARSKNVAVALTKNFFNAL